MEIVYAGLGQIGQRCRAVLDTLCVPYVLYDDWQKEQKRMDLLISVHWRDKFRKETLDKFRLGGLNLHNSYLPWNRGADACLWAIVDQSPHGVTMHWMDEGIDTGPILAQMPVRVDPEDTTDSLYSRTVEAEVDLFKIVFGVNGAYAKILGFPRVPQQLGGSYHRKSDKNRLIRALTTSDMKVTQCTELSS